MSQQPAPPIDPNAWMTYALNPIRTMVDIPRERMSDEQLSVYPFAANALAGGEPVIPFVARGAGHRLCRVCLAEWSVRMSPDHVAGCPAADARA
ncbi:hypothetical protein BJY21_002858 [Kineosphaera limosa]|uniref:Uncharacterized protein n=1 Tax=Kineosphaera limosa NBRC 100340 TaxID=1184609 RepID=K6VMJ2_9MICO|nr:hypothetical protein [Kineosphaera limosa]NYE01674.1 hypothetical protein [Kineosphaera limosa]GAB97433.1 hypothetical protein KILIM_069_00010 [Kineosphaera limosa NBRC 100340]